MEITLDRRYWSLRLLTEKNRWCGTQRCFKWKRTSGWECKGVVSILYPDQTFAPGRGVINYAPLGSLILLVTSLCLTMDCGWYVEIRLQRVLQKAFQTCEMNWGPRSETMSPMYSEHMLHQKLGSLQGGRKLDERNFMSGSGKICLSL